MTDWLKNKVVLITGGTGSFGKNFAKFLLSNSKLKKLIIFSRDEFKQFEMQNEIDDERLRFFIGDVRDLPRLEMAFRGVEVVVHAAALKQVPLLEYNPFEAVKTNIVGSQNVIEAAISQAVSKILLISTDKAAQPVNLYGATKLCAEKLFIAANAYSPFKKTKFSSVRYGNVIGSRGSIVETLIKGGGLKKIRITDPEMTRFWIARDQAFQLVMFALKNMEGGEIFIPKIPSMKLLDLVDALAPRAKKEIVGIRPGEKIHETLITEHESCRTVDIGDYFVILPAFYYQENTFKKYSQGKEVDKNFSFCSNTNTSWLTKNDIKKKIKEKFF